MEKVKLLFWVNLEWYIRPHISGSSSGDFTSDDEVVLEDKNGQETLRSVSWKNPRPLMILGNSQLVPAFHHVAPGAGKWPNGILTWFIKQPRTYVCVLSWVVWLTYPSSETELTCTGVTESSAGRIFMQNFIPRKSVWAGFSINFKTRVFL